MLTKLYHGVGVRGKVLTFIFVTPTQERIEFSVLIYLFWLLRTAIIRDKYEEESCNKEYKSHF
jgi:hypothetical protein